MFFFKALLGKLVDTENRMVVIRGWRLGQGKFGGTLFKGADWQPEAE